MKANKIASKYVLGPKIGAGSFGEVYIALQPGTTEIYALKREDEKTKTSQIFIEYRILKQMENKPGFAKIYWHGTQNKFNMIIMDMLGPSLEDLLETCGKRFSLKTCIMIVDQMIQRIQQLHNKNYVHRDIKPQNFLMGINRSSHLVHLIDFGLSKKYRDSKTHQHIPYKENKNLTGTARYASINAHLGIQQSRRDDLEAIGYVLLYFLQGYLPWQGIKANNKNEKYQKIMEKKMSIPIQIQCKGLPLQISTFLNYCRSLKFDDKPDYNFLRKILREVLERENHKFDYCYDWTIFENNRKLDNGKIKIQLRGKNGGNNLKQNCFTDQFQNEKQVFQYQEKQITQTNNNLALQSKKTKKSFFASKSDSDEDCLIEEGEQNMDENAIYQDKQKYSRANKKNQKVKMDLEDKKNKLYDEDIELDQN